MGWCFKCGEKVNQGLHESPGRGVARLIYFAKPLRIRKSSLYLAPQISQKAVAARKHHWHLWPTGMDCQHWIPENRDATLSQLYEWLISHIWDNLHRRIKSVAILFRPSALCVHVLKNPSVPSFLEPA